MPRLVKGAKWAFGWVVVGPGREIAIPPAAWDEYGFGVGGEAGPPVVVAQHDNRVPARNLILLGRERAPEGRPHAQDPEVRAGYELGGNPFRPTAKTEAHAAWESAQHAAEDLVVLAQVLVERIRDGGAAAPCAAVEPALRLDERDLLRFLDGESAQQGLIQQGEHRRVGTDAEGEGDDGHRRENLGLGESSKGRAQIFYEVFHTPFDVTVDTGVCLKRSLFIEKRYSNKK